MSEPQMPYCDCGAEQDHDERCAAQRWITDRLKDPAWVAKMKARSDKAEAQLREKGLLT